MQLHLYIKIGLKGMHTLSAVGCVVCFQFEGKQKRYFVLFKL
jgi:hypothetical protein